MAETHVDVDATKRFDRVFGEWVMFGWTMRVSCNERSQSRSATQGVVRVLDKW